jgi:GT2 family glycosyltransferase
MSSSPAVTAIILNWNNAAQTLDCLASLRQSDYPALDVIVVDNASTDDSVNIIRNAHPKVPLLVSTANLGYAGGNNLGIRRALENGAAWVFILNDDTTQAVDCLRQLVDAGEMNPKAGLLGPLVYHAEQPGVIQSAGGVMDACWRATHRGENQPAQEHFSHGQPIPVDWINGCALLVRSAMIQAIGMFDERFFLYREEVEWCVRARQAGWQVIFVPQAHLWHAGVRPDYRPKPYVTYYMTRNLFLLLAARKAGWQPWFDAIKQTARTLISWTIKPQWREQRAHRDAMWRGVRDFVGKRWGAFTP